MRLWGRVVSGSLIVFAAVFAVVAAMSQEGRVVALAVATICLAVATLGVPLLVRAFASFTGDEGVLATGLEGRATITRLVPTGWRYNRFYPIVRFELEVELADELFSVEVQQTVDPVRFAELRPGTAVAVRVDPRDRSRVVLDWRASAPPPRA